MPGRGFRRRFRSARRSRQPGHVLGPDPSGRRRGGALHVRGVQQLSPGRRRARADRSRSAGVGPRRRSPRVSCRLLGRPWLARSIFLRRLHFAPARLRRRVRGIGLVHPADGHRRPRSFRRIRRRPSRRPHCRGPPPAGRSGCRPSGRPNRRGRGLRALRRSRKVARPRASRGRGRSARGDGARGGGRELRPHAAAHQHRAKLSRGTASRGLRRAKRCRSRGTHRATRPTSRSWCSAHPAWMPAVLGAALASRSPLPGARRPEDRGGR